MATRCDEFWRDDHPVLEVLRERRRAGTTPQERQAAGDPVKVGVAVEGGGMRAVISAAMLTALEDLGLTQAFDVVYGSSAGALNAAFFLAGDCHRPLSIYYEDLPTRQFMDFTRPLRGRSILDLDYVFDDVLTRRKPLDPARVLASPVRLCIAVTNVDRQATTLISDFRDRADLWAALRASSWLPGAVRGTTQFRGERVVDGSVLTAHPWSLARADGCTHILSLSTHHLFAARRYNPVALRYAMRYLDRLEPGLGDGYRRSLIINQRDLVRLGRWMKDPEPRPYVLDLGPLPGAPAIKRHEMDPATILAAAHDGYELMLRAIDPGRTSLMPSEFTKRTGHVGAAGGP